MTVDLGFLSTSSLVRHRPSLSLFSSESNCTTEGLWRNAHGKNPPNEWKSRGRERKIDAETDCKEITIITHGILFVLLGTCGDGCCWEKKTLNLNATKSSYVSNFHRMYCVNDTHAHDWASTTQKKFNWKLLDWRSTHRPWISYAAQAMRMFDVNDAAERAQDDKRHHKHEFHKP